MSIKNAIVKALSNQLKYTRFTFFYWFILLILSFSAIKSYFSAMQQFFQSSTIVDLFYDKIFVMIGGEFQAYNPSAKMMQLQNISLIAFILMLITIPISGGIISEMVHQGKSIGKALQAGFSNFKRLFLLYLINFVFIIALTLLFLFIFKVVLAIVGNDTEVGYVLSLLVGAVLVIPLWIFKDIFYDFSRISLMNNPALKMGQILTPVISYTFKHFFKLTLFGLVMNLIMILIFLVGHFINKPFDYIGLFAIIVSFLITQSIIWLRVFWRQWMWQSEIQFWKSSDYYVYHPKFGNID